MPYFFWKMIICFHFSVFFFFFFTYLFKVFQVFILISHLPAFRPWLGAWCVSSGGTRTQQNRNNENKKTKKKNKKERKKERKRNDKNTFESIKLEFLKLPDDECVIMRNVHSCSLQLVCGGISSAACLAIDTYWSTPTDEWIIDFCY